MGYGICCCQKPRFNVAWRQVHADCQWCGITKPSGAPGGVAVALNLCRKYRHIHSVEYGTNGSQTWQLTHDHTWDHIACVDIADNYTCVSTPSSLCSSIASIMDYFLGLGTLVVDSVLDSDTHIHIEWHDLSGTWHGYYDWAASDEVTKTVQLAKIQALLSWYDDSAMGWPDVPALYGPDADALGVHDMLCRVVLSYDASGNKVATYGGAGPVWAPGTPNVGFQSTLCTQSEPDLDAGDHGYDISGYMYGALLTTFSGFGTDQTYINAAQRIVARGYKPDWVSPARIAVAVHSYNMATDPHYLDCYGYHLFCPVPEGCVMRYIPDIGLPVPDPNVGTFEMLDGNGALLDKIAKIRHDLHNGAFERGCSDCSCQAT